MNLGQQTAPTDSNAGLLSGFGLDRLAQQEDAGYNTANDGSSSTFYTANDGSSSTFYTANEGLTNTGSYGGSSDYSGVSDLSSGSSVWNDSSDASASDFGRSDSLYSDFSDIDTPVGVDNIFDRAPRDLSGERVNGLSSPIAGGLEGKTMHDANSDLLIKGGFDPDNFSPEFMSSPSVFTEISKKLNALPTNATDATVKKEITNAVNELNLKDIQGKPLDLGKDLNSMDDLAPVVQNIRASLPPGTSMEQALTDIENRAKNGDDPAEVKADLINTLGDISTAAKQKRAAPELVGMKDAVDGLSQHLKAGLLTETKESVKAQMVEHYQHLTKAGASDSTTFSFDLSLPVATALNLGVSASQSLGFSTTNNLLVSQTDSKAGGVSFDVGLHNIVTGGAGAGVSRTQEFAHMGVEKMVEFNADRLFDQLARTPVSSAANPSSVNTAVNYKDIVNAQNDSRNHQDNLEADMKNLGWLPEGDSLSSSTAHAKPASHLPFPGTDITTNMSGNVSAGNGDVSATYTTGMSHTVAIAGEYAPMLESLVSTPELLKAKEEKYVTGAEAADLKSLQNNVESVTSGPLSADNVVSAMALRTELQDKMETNGALLDAYTATARNRDDAVSNRSVGESLSALGRKILGRESKDMSGVEKHNLENELGTKGRQETLDALVTKQAGYLSLYEKLNESQLNQPITGSQLNNASRTIDGLDLAQSAPVNYKDAQTDVALDYINDGFATPNMFMSDSDVRKSNALREGEIDTYTRSSQLDLSFPAELGGISASLQGKHSQVSNHVDILRDGKVDSYSLAINGDLTSDSAINSIASQLNQAVGAEGVNAVQEALTEFRDNAAEYGGANSNITVDFEYKDDNLMYTRVSVAGDTSVGLGVDIPLIGGANLGVSSSHSEPVIEKIGPNSTYYPQIHFNGLALHEGDKTSGPGDAFSDFAQNNSNAFTNIISSLMDPDSIASQELDARRNEVRASTKGTNADVATIDNALIDLRSISQNLGNMIDSQTSSGLTPASPDGAVSSPQGSDAFSQFASSPDFEKAVDDLRTIFTTFADTARSEGFDDRQPVVVEGVSPSINQALFGKEAKALLDRGIAALNGSR